LRLPTLDTNEPTFQSLKAGVEFIDARLQQEPGSRVLIHCKGGRGRAAAMALAYYISQVRLASVKAVEVCHPPNGLRAHHSAAL